MIENQINTRLSEIEEENDVKILFACESGSRAWGFPSQNSDYDVRFIFIHKHNWYLSLKKKRDVIEDPIDGDLDINGWDIQKALLLFRKSNPPLMEWLQSPIVYQERYSLAGKLRELAKQYFSPKASMFHYMHMARGNYRDYLKGEEVRLKKYFYVLRPMLAVKWIENKMGLVPTEFDILVNGIVCEIELKRAIENLLKLKKAGNELDKGPKIQVINDFMEAEFTRFEQLQPEFSDDPAPVELLDKIFLETLAEVWE